MNAVRHLLSDKHRLSSADLARIYERHKNDPDSDAMRLWFEVDALRFELAGADERTRIAREERDDISKRYWCLQMERVPGGKV